jgi:hypothetical protein
MGRSLSIAQHYVQLFKPRIEEKTGIKLGEIVVKDILGYPNFDLHPHLYGAPMFVAPVEYDHQGGVSDGYSDSSDDSDEEGSEFRVKFSQNYRDADGSFKTVALTSEELAMIRKTHRGHCADVLGGCEEDYPDDRELQLAMFEKRCDKIFTWIQQALDEKVRRTRGQNGNQY